ncbi:MAG TPA: M1 family metallopeptidase [Planctomycetota bacterium]|nr:M1 family metallopeptidase [Planctomycetota bacterium]
MFHSRMKLALSALLVLLAVRQEKPWAPFNDPTCTRHAERVSTIDVGHYKISVRMDDRIPPPVVEGKVEIDLSLTAPSGTVELDAAEMTINEIVAGDGAKLAFTHTGEKLNIDLGRKAAAGDKFRFVVSYTARPTVGLFFITPEPDRPTRPWQVWTQGETEYNHHWFPCYDYPNDRATSEVVITVREKYRTISNGAMVKSEIAHGWRTEHWKLDIPHVTYLTSIAAGEFDVVEEQGSARGTPVPLRYFAPKGWHTPEELSHTFARTPEMMRFFSERTGFAYPYPKYDQVVVVDFTWGGMENVTATTLHPGTVVPKRSWGDRDSDGLIAHELAHQWFGDIVTCRSWAHAWLNEGFATYMASLWVEKTGGRDAMVADMDEGQEGYFRESAEYVRPTVRGSTRRRLRQPHLPQGGVDPLHAPPPRRERRVVEGREQVPREAPRGRGLHGRFPEVHRGRVGRRSQAVLRPVGDRDRPPGVQGHAILGRRVEEADADREADPAHRTREIPGPRHGAAGVPGAGGRGIPA